MFTYLMTVQPEKPFMEGYIWQNIIAGIMAAGFVILCYYLISHSFWGPRIRQAFRAISAKAGLALAMFFLIIAFMDSFSWKDSFEKNQNVRPEAREARTILDRTFSAIVGVPEYEFTEKTISAPMAKTEFYDDTRPLKYKHVFGTDAGGKDTFYRVFKGVRTAVLVGTIPLLLTLPIALFFGVAAGYFGGKLDDFVVFVYTVMASIPSLLLLIAIVATFGKDLKVVCAALGITSWISLCRLVRGETMKLRELEYIQAATCLGVPTWKIIQKHILPNLTHIILITCILTFTALVLLESILAYLGVGLTGSWGVMIASAKSEIAQDPVIWWNLVFASSFLFLLVLSVNIVGDAIRNAIDPKAAQE